MLKLADDPTKTKVQLRDGRAAGLYEVDGDRIYGWYISHDGEKYGACWHLNGSWYERTACGYDLVNTPEPPVTVERWVNVYPNDAMGGLERSKKECDICNLGNRIACVPVQITYRPGEGLEGA